MAQSGEIRADPSKGTSDLLRAKLSAYGGKSTTFLGEAEAALSANPAYLDELVALLRQSGGHFANGASWLIKSALEQGRELSEAQVGDLVAQLPTLTDWAAQLHICQSIRLLTVPAHEAKDLADWLAGLLEHQRPFLRAWSLDALGAVAQAHADHRHAFNAALASAHKDEAASVKARARNLKAL